VDHLVQNCIPGGSRDQISDRLRPRDVNGVTPRGFDFEAIIKVLVMAVGGIGVLPGAGFAPVTD
jgi:hypothetical protein